MEWGVTEKISGADPYESLSFDVLPTTTMSKSHRSRGWMSPLTGPRSASLRNYLLRRCSCSGCESLTCANMSIITGLEGFKRLILQVCINQPKNQRPMGEISPLKKSCEIYWLKRLLPLHLRILATKAAWWYCRTQNQWQTTLSLWVGRKRS